MLLDKFKKNIRMSTGKLCLPDLNRLTSNYKKEYVTMIKEED